MTNALLRGNVNVIKIHPLGLKIVVEHTADKA